MINTELKEDEYLLKVWTNPSESRLDFRKVGFLTKLNKDGSIPVKFEGWREHLPQTLSKVKVVHQGFYSGWKLLGYRRGASADWAILLHPAGYTLETKLVEFLGLLSECVVAQGELLGQFQWVKGKLVPLRHQGI
ncbi:MAG: hypothetical protein JKX82_04780 [Oleispira sp.]|nr:hypothetical protein [Oleispira sp.]